MPRACTICTHKKREKIDAALATEEALRHIASRFGTSTATLRRHRDKCIKGAIKQVIEEIAEKTPSKQLKALKAKNRGLDTGTAFLDQMSKNLEEAKAVLSEARKGYKEKNIEGKMVQVRKDPMVALKALDSINKTMGLYLDLRKETRDQEDHDLKKMKEEQAAVLKIVMEEVSVYPELADRIVKRLEGVG